MEEEVGRPHLSETGRPLNKLTSLGVDLPLLVQYSSSSEIRPVVDTETVGDKPKQGARPTPHI